MRWRLLVLWAAAAGVFSLLRWTDRAPVPGPPMPAPGTIACDGNDQVRTLHFEGDLDPGPAADKCLPRAHGVLKLRCDAERHRVAYQLRHGDPFVYRSGRTYDAAAELEPWLEMRSALPQVPWESTHHKNVLATWSEEDHATAFYGAGERTLMGCPDEPNGCCNFATSMKLHAYGCGFLGVLTAFQGRPEGCGGASPCVYPVTLRMGQ